MSNFIYRHKQVSVQLRTSKNVKTHLYSHLCKISPTLSDMLLLIALSEKGTLAETGPAMIATTFLSLFFCKSIPTHSLIVQPPDSFTTQQTDFPPAVQIQCSFEGHALFIRRDVCLPSASLAILAPCQYCKKGKKVSLFKHYLAPSNNLILKTFVQKQHWFMKDFLLGQTSTKTTYTEFIFHFLCSCVRKHNARSSQKSHASQHIIWESLLRRTHLYIQCQLISYVWVLGPEKRGGLFAQVIGSVSRTTLPNVPQITLFTLKSFSIKLNSLHITACSELFCLRVQ